MLRLKNGLGVSIFGEQMKAEVQKLDSFAGGDQIIRVERHSMDLVIEPTSKIVFYRVWTRNSFHSF